MQNKRSEKNTGQIIKKESESGNMSEKLEKARLYEIQEAKNISQEEKPAFHVSAPAGWINDPNGFSVFEGKIHLFYQYHPYSRDWGPMHWGHSVTDDMVRWEQLPAALAPDQDYDCEGCFSGFCGKRMLDSVFQIMQIKLFKKRMKHENLPETGFLHKKAKCFPYKSLVCPKKVRRCLLWHKPDELC